MQSGRILSTELRGTIEAMPKMCPTQPRSVPPIAGSPAVIGRGSTRRLGGHALPSNAERMARARRGSTRNVFETGKASPASAELGLREVGTLGRH